MSDSAIAFVTVAARFCDTLEKHDQFESPEEFLYQMRLILPDLYSHAQSLPALSGSDKNIEPDITHNQWQRMFDCLEQLLGKYNVYWIAFDPTINETDNNVASSLADDLADIWRDLKTGINNWPTVCDDTRNEIIWRWRFSFYGHWSNHCVDALRAINTILNDLWLDDPPYDA